VGDLVRLQQRILDSLSATQASMKSMRGDVANDLYNVQQQLVQLQELTGQSQRRLTELRTQLETSKPEPAPAPAAPAGSDTSSVAPLSPPANAPSADQMYEASLQQLRKGSAATARGGFRELLKTYPSHEHAPDATYFIGQSFQSDQPDSAAFYYGELLKTYPQSTRAPAALYNLGLLAERRKDAAGAKDAYQRVVKQYPRSDEAALARDRLKALGK
jgi:tol-pal system protein YbgF